MAAQAAGTSAGQSQMDAAERETQRVLIEAQESEIRELSSRYGLETAEKPSMPCLATRFPYGTEITTELLRRVDAAETHLRDAGFPVVRVRCHGNLARIEVERDRIPELLEAVESALRRSPVVIVEPVRDQLLKVAQIGAVLPPAAGRYRRQDEIGTPFAVTFDFDSLDDRAVTIRDRDTMEQDRIPIEGLIQYLRERLP